MPSDPRSRFITPADPEFEEARRLRYSVLYEPLGIAETDIDWHDGSIGTAHCVVFEGGHIAGYGRVIARGSEAQIRHLAVSPAYRGRGVGGTLLDALIDHAKSRGASRVHLNARFTALGMYRARGFQAVGPVFSGESTHLPHQRMELAVR